MKYVTLTMLQKKQLCDHHTALKIEGQPPTLNQLAEWAKNKFKLHTLPNKSTISRTLKRVTDLTVRSRKSIERRTRDKKGRNHVLETQLFHWIVDQQNNRRNINGPLLRTQARKLQDMANERLPAEQRFSMTFSDGWLSNFNRRWGLRVFRSYGEGGDADLEAVRNELPLIKEKVRQYQPKDIFNCDESGLFYKMAPDKTIAQHRLPGRKKQKDRITFMPCCNSDGSEKFEVMFIGKSQQPRVFKKRSGAQLGLDYHNNSRSWMTTELFYAWLGRFNNYIGTTDGRKVLLLMDNCSAHGSIDSMPSLSHVEIQFLPPNTTSKLQPLDAGIIAAMKTRYRVLQMERALDLVDENVRNIYKVDILTAMRWVKRVWNDLPSSVISNCWKHTGLLSEEKTISRVTTISSLCNAPAPESEVVGVLEEQVSSLVPSRVRMSVTDLLNPEGELEDCRQTVTDEELVTAMLGDESDSDQEVASSQTHEPDSVPLPSSTEQLRVLALAKRIVEEKCNGIERATLHSIREAQRVIRMEKSSGLTQTRISSFFN